MRKILIGITIILTMAACTQGEQETFKAKTSEGVSSEMKSKETPKVENDKDEQVEQQEDDEVEEKDETNEPNDQSDDTQEKQEPKENEDGIITVPNPHATDVVVNKQRRLPKGFVPNNLVEPNVAFRAPEGHPKRKMKPQAANALEELFAAAKDSGFQLYAQSGYRSIDRQRFIYNNNVETKGREHANKFSAVPGHSEHHTGLAMDVTIALEAGGFLGLEQAFGNTEPGQWVAQNAHKYGFVIRYPEGKSHITGYSYEPWHLRYFGKDLATKIYKSGLTVEEYFGYVN